MRKNVVAPEMVSVGCPKIKLLDYNVGCPKIKLLDYNNIPRNASDHDVR